jgi:hypothetical protein
MLIVEFIALTEWIYSKSHITLLMMAHQNICNDFADCGVVPLTEAIIVGVGNNQPNIRMYQNRSVLSECAG